MQKPLLTLAGLMIASLAFGHEGEEHLPVHTHEAKSASITETSLHSMQSSFSQSVAPIFEAKCYACHSTKTDLPWYYKLPGVRQLIDSDVDEARTHMEMSKGFPFTSRHAIEEDFNDLRDVVEEGKMPPHLYVFMHAASKLTEDDKKTILDWIDSSKMILKNAKKE